MSTYDASHAAAQPPAPPEHDVSHVAAQPPAPPEHDVSHVAAQPPAPPEHALVVLLPTEGLPCEAVRSMMPAAAPSVLVPSPSGWSGVRAALASAPDAWMHSVRLEDMPQLLEGLTEARLGLEPIVRHDWAVGLAGSTGRGISFSAALMSRAYWPTRKHVFACTITRLR